MKVAVLVKGAVTVTVTVRVLCVLTFFLVSDLPELQSKASYSPDTHEKVQESRRRLKPCRKMNDSWFWISGFWSMAE